jgi:hypothetical protein
MLATSTLRTETAALRDGFEQRRCPAPVLADKKRRVWREPPGQVTR